MQTSLFSQITTKKCSKCGEIKQINCFNKDSLKKDLLYPSCKKCGKEKHAKYYQKHKKEAKKYKEENREYIKQWRKEYYQKYKKEDIEYAKIWAKNNPEKRKESRKKWDKNNPEKIKEYKRKWKKNNSGYESKYCKERRKNDVEFRIRGNVSSSISQNLKRSLLGKGGKSFLEILGKDYVKNFKKHMEFYFESWMNWTNWDKKPGHWTIDHTIAQSKFKFINLDGTKNLEEIRKCWALENLRPMEYIANIKKGNR